jgi:hypothetical protein
MADRAKILHRTEYIINFPSTFLPLPFVAIFSMHSHLLSSFQLKGSQVLKFQPKRDKTQAFKIGLRWSGISRGR